MPHLYVHVPFCQRRCSYCDFSIAVRKHIPAREYVDAVLGELAAVYPADSGREPRGFGGESLDTLYLGGGTPSGSEEHTSELQSRPHLGCRLLLVKKKQITLISLCFT